MKYYLAFRLRPNEPHEMCDNGALAFDTFDEAQRAIPARASSTSNDPSNYVVVTKDNVIIEGPKASKPVLTTDKGARKNTPMARGLVDYFPRALAAVAHVSFVGNEQHNPGQPMHWAKGKSTDHADCIVRHLVERGTVDDDTLRHSAKLAWRALALLEIELEEAEKGPTP